MTKKDNENIKKEKSKEEKEQELFNNINEAVKLGMSIEDNYFEKLEAKKGEESDDEPELNVEGVDLIIYEAKNPYQLRSLPYIIGSKAYLDNDHVGLRDLESEDEEEEEEVEEKEENEKKNIEESSEDEMSEKEENKPTINEPTTKTKLPNLNADTDSDDSEDFDRGLFASDRKVYNFFLKESTLKIVQKI